MGLMEGNHSPSQREAQIRAYTIVPYAQKVVVVDYDPTWPALFHYQPIGFG